MNTLANANGEKWEKVACDFCGCEDTTVYLDKLSDTTNFTEGEFSLVKCCKCGLIFLNPRPFFEFIGTYYDDDYYEKKSGKRFNFIVEAFLDFLRSFRIKFIYRFKKSGAILDVGCGRGDLLAKVEKCGWEVAGTQISANSVKTAKKNYGLDIFYGDFLKSGFPEEHFDVVSFYYVLEHVHQPKAYLKKAKELLKSDGIMIIAIPDGDSFQAAFFRKNWLMLEPPRHLYMFNRKSLKRIFDALGLKIIKKSHFAWDMNPFSLLQSIMNLFLSPPNLFFNLMKHRRIIQRSNYNPSLLLIAVHLFAAALLVIPVIIVSFALSLMKSGDIITYVLRKEDDR